MSDEPALLFPCRIELSQGRPWQRGTLRIFWRSQTNAVAPYYVRLHRRNPVDHKKLRLRRLEVWW